MPEPSLSYLFSHPTSLGIGAERPLLLALLLVTPLFFVLRPAGSRRSVRLRSAAFVALVLALAGLRVTTALPDQRLTLVALVDLSESIDDGGRAWAERYLREVAAALAPEDELAVMAFAADVDVLRAPGPPDGAFDLAPPQRRGATHLGTAISSALALFADSGQRRILLLTDGNETDGDSRRHIPRLREAGVRLDAAVAPHEQGPDSSVDKLVVASLVAENQTVPVRVVTRNAGRRRTALLTFYLDDQLLDSVAVELQPGINTFDLPTQLSGRGSHRLEARLAAEEDTRAANDSRQTGVTVIGRTRALVVTSRGRSLPGAVLARRGIEAEVVAPDRFPASLAEMLAYQCIILEDLRALDLSRQRIADLERFVREFGGGLVFAAGATSFGDPGLAGTALKRLLPVTFEPGRPSPANREPLALFVVIDRSNSMGYNSRIGTLRDGEKVRYAKEAALAVVQQLRDEDLVGVVAFDSMPHEIAPLKPLRDNRARLLELIPRLVESGGTDFYDALESARSQLAASRVQRRHLILLTDGDTNRSSMEEYEPLIASIAAAGISVTTIRVGDNTVNLKLLREISERSGGQFHYVEDAQTLPDLMLREATRAIGPLSRGAEQFYPRTRGRNQILLGIEEQHVPPLTAYAYARRKRGAEVLLQVTRLERRDPILTVWQYGLGRVAAFTASPLYDTEQWMAWRDLGKFWSQLTQWTARRHVEGDYAIEARRRDGVVELAVGALGPEADDAVLLGRLHLGEQETMEVALTPDGARRFSARIPELAGGRYPLTILERRGGKVLQKTEMVTIPERDTELPDEHRRQTPNLPLLTSLTEATGGILNPSARQLAERPAGTRRAAYPLEPLLLPLAMLLFLADVAVRRLGLEGAARTRLAEGSPRQS